MHLKWLWNIGRPESKGRLVTNKWSAYFLQFSYIITTDFKSFLHNAHED
jgi:hypothetical protein